MTFTFILEAVYLILRVRLEVLEESVAAPSYTLDQGNGPRLSGVVVFFRLSVQLWEGSMWSSERGRGHPLPASSAELTLAISKVTDFTATSPSHPAFYLIL